MPAWQYPFVWAAVGLIGGILLHRVSLSWTCILFGGITLLAAYLWFFARWGRLVWSLPLFALLGWGRAYIDEMVSATDLQHLRGHLVRFSGYLIEEPLRTRRAYRLLLQVDSIYPYRSRRWFPAQGKLLLYTRDSSTLNLPVGVRIGGVCRLDSIKYAPDYWRQQGVYTSGFSETIEIGRVEWTYLGGYFRRVRQRLVQAIQAATPKEGAPLAVIQALLLGYKRGIDPETREAFQLSGAAHILAVSGMHVGLVLTLWLFLLRQLPAGWNHHRSAQLFLLGLLVFYGFLTGASPSAMRAVIMGSVALLARMLYERYLPLNALSFAAFLQAATDSQIIYHIGFQLSYAAVGGILAFYGFFQYLFSSYRLRNRKVLWHSYITDLVALSLAAQMGTFFLSWAYFGRFPLYFLLTNLLAVPIATALAFAAVGWVSLVWIPILGEIVGYPVYGLAWLLVIIVESIARLPGASITLPALAPWVGVVLTVGLLTIGGVIAHKRLRMEATPWLV